MSCYLSSFDFSQQDCNGPNRNAQVIVVVFILAIIFVQLIEIIFKGVESKENEENRKRNSSAAAKHQNIHARRRQLQTYQD